MVKMHLCAKFKVCTSKVSAGRALTDGRTDGKTDRGKDGKTETRKHGSDFITSTADAGGNKQYKVLSGKVLEGI